MAVLSSAVPWLSASCTYKGVSYLCGLFSLVRIIRLLEAIVVKQTLANLNTCRTFSSTTYQHLPQYRHNEVPIDDLYFPTVKTTLPY